MIKFSVFCIFAKILLTQSEEIWEQDMTNDMKIGEATSGYEKVNLRCGSNSMEVDITLDDSTFEDFDGVIYTRGSFHKKQAPCFIDAQDPKSRSKNGRSFTLKFPLNKCQTLHSDGKYSNVIVVQYDKDLIMPGDVAFNVECDFSSPRDVTVNANLQEKSAKSKITLTDADPAAVQDNRYKRSIAESDSDSVEFTPNHILKS